TGRGVGQPVQGAGVDVGAVTGGGDAAGGRVLLTGVDDHSHRQVEGAGERQVALIVCRDRHQGTGTVVGQHVVGRPHRDPFAVHRVGGVHAQEDPGLGAFGRLPFDLGGALGLLQVLLEGGALLRCTD